MVVTITVVMIESVVIESGWTIGHPVKHNHGDVSDDVCIGIRKVDKFQIFLSNPLWQRCHIFSGQHYMFRIFCKYCNILTNDGDNLPMVMIVRGATDGDGGWGEKEGEEKEEVEGWSRRPASGQGFVYIE